jgi:hypothetical protein
MTGNEEKEIEEIIDLYKRLNLMSNKNTINQQWRLYAEY